MLESKKITQISPRILLFRRKTKTREVGYMTKRENYLRAVRFERPDHIPMTFAINPACWQAYPHEALYELQETHPFLFPEFRRPPDGIKPFIHPVARKGEPYTDDFGCVWETTEDGITGTVTKHPLTEWSSFESYGFPNPETCMGIGPIDWQKITAEIAASRAHGELTWGGLRHGHTFLQLCDQRGYDLIEDLIDGGVEVINLQDLVNGVDWIADRFSGKVCVDLDIDRQVVTPYGTPAQIDELIRSEVTSIGRKEGGLMMIYGLYPGVPLENIKALMDAMEKYAFQFN